MNTMPALLVAATLVLLSAGAVSQPVSGVWHGRVDARSGILKSSYRVELKLARQGDSLYGTCYYHAGRREYARFPVRGFFNPFDGTVTWWHDRGTGVDENGRAVPSPVGAGASYVADFNCPSGEEMSLDGELTPKTGAPRGSSQPVHFEKVPEPLFRDEWDDALNDPSTDLAALNERPRPQNPVTPTPMRTEPPSSPRATERKEDAQPSEKPAAGETERRREPVAEPRQEEKTPETLFERRRRPVVTEIPLKGDTLELNFYDHAEIDGDTVSIFHNGVLLQKHLLLKAEPFTLRFHVGSLPERNEFTMVAENLGRIPPNTSLLVAYVDGVRHEARLESNENESATVRFDKPKGR
jgi:hypothetical protein